MGVPGSADFLNRPPWVALALAAAVATALACYPTWPGYMSYDSLLAYEQARYGVRTALWPPLHSYMFFASRAVGADTWGLFLAQTFALLFGAGLTLHVLVDRRILAWALCGFFVGGLVFFPTLLGALGSQWRDVPTGSFAILGLGLWLAGAQARSIPLLILAILMMCVSVALRYNAFVLVGPALALMVWRPFLGGGPSLLARTVVVHLVILGLVAAWASTQWRLPDLLPLPNAQNFSATQEFDVIGVSACAGRNYLPAGITNGQPISVAQIRRAYDPRHMLMTLAPQPGVPRMLETNAGGAVERTWAHLLTAEPGCYLAHRAAVMVEQMGMAKDAVFYPTHGAIDANPFGLALRHPQVSQQVVNYVRAHADETIRRPWVLYGLAIIFGLLAAARNRQAALLILALVAGAFAYPALLFVAAPAADARYIFPSNVLSLLIVTLALGLSLTRRERVRR